MNRSTSTIPVLCILALLSACGKESTPAPANSTPAPAATTSSTAAPPANPLDPSVPAPVTATPTTSSTGAAGEPTHLVANTVAITIPAGWEQQTPSSSMRAAQYRVPAPAGSGLADGELVLFRGIRGSAADNILRWQNQVSDRKADPIEATQTAHGYTVQSIILYGTYNAGMAQPGTGPMSDWGFAGAVISGDPEGDLHLRLAGPRPVVEANLGEWEAMLASILEHAAPKMR